MIEPRRALAAVAVAAAFVMTTSPGAESATLTCVATASPKTPKHGQAVIITTKTAARAAVTTTAHYKTTTTTHTGMASAAGVSKIRYDIGSATSGYTVVVDVAVALGVQHASCSTSFTPK